MTKNGLAQVTNPSTLEFFFSYDFLFFFIYLLIRIFSFGGKMPIFDKCCFCVQLQTGGVILGWLGVISSGFTLFFSCVGFALLDQIVIEITNDPRHEEQHTVSGTLVAMSLAALTVSSIVALASSICLLIGSIKVCSSSFARYAPNIYYNFENFSA